MTQTPTTPAAAAPATQALTPYQQRAMELREHIGQDATPRAIVPRTFSEAQAFASAMAGSLLVPEKLRDRAPDVLMIILAGSEKGIPPIQALTLFHVIEGVPKLSADGVAGIVNAHPLCEYLEPREQSDERVMWVAKKINRPEMTLVWDKAAATRAGLWGKRNWAGYPRQMLNARCKAELARLVFPEVCAGLVTAEEARDMIEINAADPGAAPTSSFSAPPPPAAPITRVADLAPAAPSSPPGKSTKASTKADKSKPIDTTGTESTSNSTPSSTPSANTNAADTTPSANTSTASTSAASTLSSDSSPPSDIAPAVTASTSPAAESAQSAPVEDSSGFGGDDEPPTPSDVKTIEEFERQLAALVQARNAGGLTALKADWIPWSKEEGKPHAQQMRNSFSKAQQTLGIK